MEQFLNWLADLLNINVDNAQTGEYMDAVWWVGGIVAVLLVGWLLTRSRNWFFKRPSNDELDYEVEIDNIHEIDYAKEMAAARSRGDYRALCRLIYLQTLKHLSDSEHIEWRPFKTPSQYTREMNDHDFSMLTNHFLRIRYGNFDATETLSDEMQQLQRRVMDAFPPRDPEAKGGEA